MFAKPRPKKNLLVAPSKKRKATHAIEEISFDTDARSEYLTGFHKRKLQRIKNAQEQAAKREREEKVEFRKQIREDRRREVEEHVSAVNALLKEADRAGGVDGKASEDSADEDGGDGDGDDEEWIGLPDAPTALAPIDHEEEYIDEDKYTAVTVESVSVGRDGLYKPEEEQQREEEAERKAAEARQAAQARVERPKKKKKPTFRYENKADRAWSTQKEKARHRRKGRS